MVYVGATGYCVALGTRRSATKCGRWWGGRTNERVSERMDKRTDRRTKGRTDVRTKCRTEGRTDEHADRQLGGYVE